MINEHTNLIWLKYSLSEMREWVSIVTCIFIFDIAKAIGIEKTRKSCNDLINDRNHILKCNVIFYQNDWWRIYRVLLSGHPNTALIHIGTIHALKIIYTLVLSVRQHWSMAHQFNWQIIFICAHRPIINFNNVVHSFDQSHVMMFNIPHMICVAGQLFCLGYILGNKNHI